MYPPTPSSTHPLHVVCVYNGIGSVKRLNCCCEASRIRNVLGVAEAQRVYQNLTLHVHSQGRACATCEEKAFSDAVASHLANFTIGNNVAWRFHNLELGRQKLEEGLQKQVLVDDGPWHPKDKLLHAIRSKQARRFRRRLVLPARTFAWNIHPTGARGSFLHVSAYCGLSSSLSKSCVVQSVCSNNPCRMAQFVESRT